MGSVSNSKNNLQNPSVRRRQLEGKIALFSGKNNLPENSRKMAPVLYHGCTTSSKNTTTNDHSNKAQGLITTTRKNNINNLTKSSLHFENVQRLRKNLVAMVRVTQEYCCNDSIVVDLDLKLGRSEHNNSNNNNSSNSNSNNSNSNSSNSTAGENNTSHGAIAEENDKEGLQFQLCDIWRSLLRMDEKFFLTIALQEFRIRELHSAFFLLYNDSFNCNHIGKGNNNSNKIDNSNSNKIDNHNSNSTAEANASLVRDLSNELQGINRTTIRSETLFSSYPFNGANNNGNSSEKRRSSVTLLSFLVSSAGDDALKADLVNCFGNYTSTAPDDLKNDKSEVHTTNGINSAANNENNNIITIDKIDSSINNSVISVVSNSREDSALHDWLVMNEKLARKYSSFIKYVKQVGVDLIRYMEGSGNSDDSSENNANHIAVVVRSAPNYSCAKTVSKDGISTNTGHKSKNFRDQIADENTATNLATTPVATSTKNSNDSICRNSANNGQNNSETTGSKFHGLLLELLQALVEDVLAHGERHVVRMKENMVSLVSNLAQNNNITENNIAVNKSSENSNSDNRMSANNNTSSNNNNNSDDEKRGVKVALESDDRGGTRRMEKLDPEEKEAEGDEGEALIEKSDNDEHYYSVKSRLTAIDASLVLAKNYRTSEKKSQQDAAGTTTKTNAAMHDSNAKTGSKRSVIPKPRTGFTSKVLDTSDFLVMETRKSNNNHNAFSSSGNPKHDSKSALENSMIEVVFDTNEDSREDSIIIIEDGESKKASLLQKANAVTQSNTNNSKEVEYSSDTKREPVVYNDHGNSNRDSNSHDSNSHNVDSNSLETPATDAKKQEQQHSRNINNNSINKNAVFSIVDRVSTKSAIIDELIKYKNSSGASEKGFPRNSRQIFSEMGLGAGLAVKKTTTNAKGSSNYSSVNKSSSYSIAPKHISTNSNNINNGNMNTNNKDSIASPAARKNNTNTNEDDVAMKERNKNGNVDTDRHAGKQELDKDEENNLSEIASSAGDPAYDSVVQHYNSMAQYYRQKGECNVKNNISNTSTSSAANISTNIGTNIGKTSSEYTNNIERKVNIFNNTSKKTSSLGGVFNNSSDNSDINNRSHINSNTSKNCGEPERTQLYAKSTASVGEVVLPSLTRLESTASNRFVSSASENNSGRDTYPLMSSGRDTYPLMADKNCYATTSIFGSNLASKVEKIINSEASDTHSNGNHNDSTNTNRLRGGADIMGEVIVMIPGYGRGGADMGEGHCSDVQLNNATPSFSNANNDSPNTTTKIMLTDVRNSSNNYIDNATSNSYNIDGTADDRCKGHRAKEAAGFEPAGRALATEAEADVKIAREGPAISSNLTAKTAEQQAHRSGHQMAKKTLNDIDEKKAAVVGTPTNDRSSSVIPVIPESRSAAPSASDCGVESDKFRSPPHPRGRNSTHNTSDCVRGSRERTLTTDARPGAMAILHSERENNNDSNNSNSSKIIATSITSYHAKDSNIIDAPIVLRTPSKEINCEEERRLLRGERTSSKDSVTSVTDNMSHSKKNLGKNSTSTKKQSHAKSHSTSSRQMRPTNTTNFNPNADATNAARKTTGTTTTRKSFRSTNRVKLSRKTSSKDSRFSEFTNATNAPLNTTANFGLSDDEDDDDVNNDMINYSFAGGTNNTSIMGDAAAIEKGIISISASASRKKSRLFNFQKYLKLHQDRRKSYNLFPDFENCVFFDNQNPNNNSTTHNNTSVLIDDGSNYGAHDATTINFNKSSAKNRNSNSYATSHNNSCGVKSNNSNSSTTSIVLNDRKKTTILNNNRKSSHSNTTNCRDNNASIITWSGGRGRKSAFSDWSGGCGSAGNLHSGDPFVMGPDLTCGALDNQLGGGLLSAINSGVQNFY